MARVNTETGIIRGAGAVALFAWFMLFAQTFAHADHMDHKDLPSNHCLMCSVGSLEDDITPGSCPVESITPIGNAASPAPERLTSPVSEKQNTSAARAPPHR